METLSPFQRRTRPAITGATKIFPEGVMRKLANGPNSNSSLVFLSISQAIGRYCIPAPKVGDVFSLINSPFTKNCLVSVARLKNTGSLSFFSGRNSASNRMEVVGTTAALEFLKSTTLLFDIKRSERPKDISNSLARSSESFVCAEVVRGKQIIAAIQSGYRRFFIKGMCIKHNDNMVG